MKKILLTLSTLAIMASCNQKQAESVPALDRANFDESVALNEDFYQYATGGWQKNNPLKPEFARYGTFDVLRENNEIRLNDLFASMTKSKAEQGSVEQKIADLYTMGLDSTRLNKEGVAPVKQDIEQILSLSEREHLAIATARIHTSAGNPFFGMYVSADLLNSNINVLYIDQSGLGMGNRDYYLDEENAAKREGYTIEQAENEREASTVGELMQLLEDFDEDTKVYISNDNGYTYGSVTEYRIREDWVDEDE